jgi:photosynthetic reaction center cytochrome c subunit
VFPAYRKGELGDSPKINCATCHQGIYKPLYGVSMLSSFKTELGGPPAVQAAAEVKPATDTTPNPVQDKPPVPAPDKPATTAPAVTPPK